MKNTPQLYTQILTPHNTLDWRSLLTPPTTRLKHNYCVTCVQIIHTNLKVHHYIIIIYEIYVCKRFQIIDA